MFQTVLIANRGEIACRIIQTLRRLGIRSVAVYSDADAGARHVQLADQAVRLGPAAASESYLNIELVIAAARNTGAEAIHPGYGFLAENADFARACAEADIVFIGPSVDAISIMGDKITAKLAVQKRDVPTVPGITEPGLSDADLIARADSVGYPLLIKPSAGGGGKGMHVVTDGGALEASLAAARREAAASFGDDTLFIERLVQTPRHIEVQVLADNHGNVIHLGERECSLQRRHQKVIEEAPSALLDEATRARIGQAACDTARSVDYRGAGTVEFIVAADAPDEFFFMEMNTRLQVEHPVTEEVTGVDLVEQQIRIAAGEVLALAQDDIAIHGHSIEARVYAEDPAAGFLPTGGHVARIVHPVGDGIRVDTALRDGLDVSIDYDPMLAKIIATGANRDEARRALVAALENTALFGFGTNVDFLRGLLELPDVIAGNLDTDLIARQFDEITFATAGAREATEAALILDAAGPASGIRSASSASAADATNPDNASLWHAGTGWRLGSAAPRRYRLTTAGDTHEVLIGGTRTAPTVITENGAVAASVTLDDASALVTVGGLGRRVFTHRDGTLISIAHGGAVFEFALARTEHASGNASTGGAELVSPMPGTVILCPAENGQTVAEGDPVVVVEAMKMEHVIRAASAGVVRIHVSVGDAVTRGQLLADVTADEEQQ